MTLYQALLLSVEGTLQKKLCNQLQQKLCDRLQLGLRLLAYLRSGRRGLDDFVAGLERLDASEFAPCEELREALCRAVREALE